MGWRTRFIHGICLVVIPDGRAENSCVQFNREQGQWLWILIEILGKAKRVMLRAKSFTEFLYATLAVAQHSLCSDIGCGR